MASKRTWWQKINGSVVLISLLLNLAAPVPVMARAEHTIPSGPSLGVMSRQHSAIPAGKSIYFDPPEQTEPQDSDPHGDELPPVVPRKGELEFYASAARQAGAGDVFMIQVTIRNRSSQGFDGLLYQDALEEGLDYDGGAATGLTFNPLNRELSYQVSTLAPDEEVNFQYSVKITDASRPALNGKAWLHNASLTHEDGSRQRTSMLLPVNLAEAQDSELTLAPGGRWQQLGRLNIVLGQRTVGQDAVVITTPVEDASQGPQLQFRLSLYTTSIANAQDEAPAEQALTLDSQFGEVFQEPAFLEINLDGYADLSHIPAGQEPYVATFDEAAGVWVKVPILEQHPESNSVIVQAAHFSVWGAGLGSSLPQNGANVLLFDQPYTSLFTGSARYSLPVWTPPGRAGMAPDITLSYSSATMDGVLGDVQGSWVGAGWNIDNAEIVRKITTNINGYGYANSFALSLNGTIYSLVQDMDHPDHFYTDHDAFLYITRHNYALYNEKPDGSDLTPPNTSGEWWEVVTADGTRLRLGWNKDSEQLALMYGYACTQGGVRCNTPEGVIVIWR